MTPELSKQHSDRAGASQDPPLQIARGGRVPDDEEDIIDLGRYVRVFERRWKLAVVAAVIGGAAAFGLASLRPVMYQGVTTLLVVPPSVATGVINPATFRSVVENGTLVKQVIEELKLNITPQVFLETALNVEQLKDTNIVKVKVQLTDPTLAAESSRRLAAKAVRLTQEVNQQEGASIQDQLKTHLEGAQTRLQSAEKNLLDYKQTAQVDAIKVDTDAQLRERGELIQLMVDIEADRARLSAAETEQKRQQPMLAVPRNAKAEEALLTALPAAKGENDPTRLDLSNPFVNPVYQTLDFQIAMIRTRLAAAEKQRDQLMLVKKLGAKELEQLSELYRRQIALARLQANFDLATRVYNDLAL